jgi:ribosomal protein S18 acetylase RimI-like enzyme
VTASNLTLIEVGSADLEAILTLTNASEIADTGEIDLGRADVAAALAADGTRAWALVDPTGSGYQALTWLEVLPGRPSQTAEFFVHPACDPEVAAPVVEALLAAKHDDHAGRKLHVIVSSNAPTKAAVLRKHGGRVVRHFFKMVTPLDAAPPAVDWPASSSVRILTDSDDDLRPIHLTLSEAFQDHWEHTSLDFDAWQARHRGREDYDPSLWWLVLVDGEPAAGAVCAARESGGLVGAIGVRRPYRGMGLARALLYTAFAEFARRGFTEASLFVDSTNPTGAVQVYESVGMHVAAQWDTYEFPARAEPV